MRKPVIETHFRPSPERVSDIDDGKFFIYSAGSENVLLKVSHTQAFCFQTNKLETLYMGDCFLLQVKESLLLGY